MRGKLVPIPINRTTLNVLFDLDLKTDEEAADYLALARRAGRGHPDLRGRRRSTPSGRELYELFFRGYTRKQWGLDPSELDKQVTARIPTRTNTDDRYFTDTFQAMPRTAIPRCSRRMLDHPLIEVRTGIDFRDVQDAARNRRPHRSSPARSTNISIIRFGKLPYRSLQFDHQTLEQEQFQEIAVVNYPRPEVPYTRISEYKHLTGQEHRVTTITYEYPSAEGDPYYPIPRPENQELFKRYEALADETEGVTFVGRLATYRYYNMDQIVGQALATFRRMDEKRQTGERPQPTRGRRRMMQTDPLHPRTVGRGRMHGRPHRRRIS